MAPTSSSSSSSSSSTHQAWVPYEPTKDCSMGLCSVYCPQWCYLLPPPPPPPPPPQPHLDLLLPIDSSSSSSSSSPLVIAIIGVLASALLLLAYYTLVSDRCGAAALIRRLLLPPPPPPPPSAGVGPGAGHAHRPETPLRAASPPNGLDEGLISRIRVCRYRKGEWLVEGSDCSVCLSEFQEEERLRLLPTCSHAFHVQCIDAWLKSHSNCPLCRATIAVPDEESINGGGRDQAVVQLVVDDDVEFVFDEEGTHVGHGNREGFKLDHPITSQYPRDLEERRSQNREDGAGSTTGPQPQRLHQHPRRGAASIAEALRMSTEDGMSAADRGERWFAGYWGGGGGGGE